MRDREAAAIAPDTCDSSPNVWIFEDQLSPQLSSLAAAPSGRVFMVESRRAFAAWPFHKRRLAFLASAMRHFANELRSLGRTVDYHSLADEPYRDAIAAIREQVARSGSRVFVVARPSEHHARAWLDTLPERIDIEIRTVENNLFLTDRVDFADWFGRQRRPVMEAFYRRARIEHRLLMDGEAPAGGAWNLDKLNRKPARRVPRPLPAVPTFPPDATTSAAIADVERCFPGHPGTTVGFAFPVTRADARVAFDDFLAARLPGFGDYEDAMLAGEPTLFHSQVSLLMNAGLLEPLACCRAVEDAYRHDRASLNAAEGYVRQIIGWREYVHGVYETLMPEYRERNARGSSRPLPHWFWTGETDLNCLHHSIGGVVARGWAHHIQRLMIICNFATLAGLGPQAVNDWFYAMFVDAHDWVVTPNVIGIGMNADARPGEIDGTLGTKPYVASASYIDRMSDYCASCRFDPKQRTGADACPFNYLYWTFLSHYREPLERNSRMRMLLKHLDSIAPEDMRAMMLKRKQFLEVTIAGGKARTARFPA